MKKKFINFIDLRKIYNNGFVAVKEFNLSIDKGEFITLLGPSGCGKTTVLRMLAGFEYPTQGRILHNGLDIKDTSVNNRPTATVFQDYALFPNMTVKQNIEYGLKAMKIQFENLKKETSSKSTLIYNDALKKSQNKIKGLEKQRHDILKQIKKCDSEYERKKNWLEIKEMRFNEFNARINKLTNELYKKYGENFTTKQKLLNTIKDEVNWIFLKLKISYRLDVSSKAMNDIEKKIFKLTNIYSAKYLLDKKYDNLKNKYNDLDFDISYWQNFPKYKKEKFLQKNGSRKLTKEEINERSVRVIELVGLKGKESSMPNELSGGMQQRVALARAIVIEPEIILLDEPLSALDAKVRAQMQRELKRLHNELKITFILVTHDQEEALSLSDRVVVMSEGIIEQVGTPNEIYDYPKNKWVAKFIGRANLFEGSFYSTKNVSFLGLNQKAENKYNFRNNSAVTVMIRPEDFDIVEMNKGFINVIVDSIEYRGLLWDIKCSFGDKQIYVEGINKVMLGSTIGLMWDIEDIHVIKGA